MATWLSVLMRGFGGALGAGVRRTHFERRLSGICQYVCAILFNMGGSIPREAVGVSSGVARSAIVDSKIRG